MKKRPRPELTCRSLRSIIRILWMVPVYSVVAWISILFYHDAVYFEVIGNCYEAFCIAAFFGLMCHYIAPDLHSQKDYFRGIQPKTWLWPLNHFQKWKWCGGERLWRNPRSGLTWFNVSGGRFRGWKIKLAGWNADLGPSADYLDWCFPILRAARVDDRGFCARSSWRQVLRRVNEPGICARLGML